MREGRSPWFYPRTGCVLLLGLLASITGTCVFVGLRTSMSVQRQIDDPANREALALELLGAERLPVGYHASMSLTVPFVMKMVILSTSPAERETPTADSFVYVSMRRGPAIVDDVLGPSQGLESILAGQGFVIRPEETLRRGTLGAGRQQVDYLAQRGHFARRPSEGELLAGWITSLSIRCPGDPRSRSAVWLVSAEDDGGEGKGDDAAPERTGTPADPDRLLRFLSHLDLCGG